MEDKRIVELYWERSESAIEQTRQKYGRYCHYIAYNILYSDEDAEECVNDTYLKAWESMPPHKPERLSTFLGKITRNIALNRYARSKAAKRSAGLEVALEEIAEIIPDRDGGLSSDEDMALREAINEFVAALPLKTRVIFVRRYWYLSSIKDISKDYGMPEGSVKSVLSRQRKRFREYLLKKGINI